MRRGFLILFFSIITLVFIGCGSDNNPNSSNAPVFSAKFSSEFLGGVIVKFTSNSSVVLPILSYSWEFGDGKTSTDISPTHTFEKGGEYAVKLTVVDGVNNTYSVTEKINVKVNIVAIGSTHNFILTTTQKLYNWGENLGKSPIEMLFFTSNNIKIKSLIVGTSHALALTDDGKVYAWGYNEFGQLGIGASIDDLNKDGTKDGALLPQQIIFPTANTIIKEIYAGGDHNFAVDTNGDLYAWGNNEYGQLGIGTTVDTDQCLGLGSCMKTPNKIATPPSAIRTIYAGASYNFAVLEDNDIYAWGSNISSQLLTSHTTGDRCTAFDDACLKLPTKVTHLIPFKVKSVSLGSSYAFAISDDNKVYGWGGNSNGQLGLGNTQDKLTPEQVTFFNDKQIKEIVAGKEHTVALTEDRKVYSWGANDLGQLGLGSAIGENKLTPQHIISLDNKNIRNIVSSQNNTLAVSDNDSLYVWGDDMFDQLGIGGGRDMCGISNDRPCLISPELLIKPSN